MRVVWYPNAHYEIGILGSNDIWRYFCFLYWQKLPLQPIATLIFFFFWSANYANLYILEISGYIKIVCLGRFFVLTYIEQLFSTVCCIFSYISWLVNCKSWVSKFHHFFLGYLETVARFIFEGFLSIFRYGKFISKFSGLI